MSVNIETQDYIKQKEIQRQRQNRNNNNNDLIWSTYSLPCAAELMKGPVIIIYEDF